MYSLPDLEALNSVEREHINQILQKLEQTQQPYIVSAVAKSKSVGDLERPGGKLEEKLDEESRESSRDILEKKVNSFWEKINE